MQRAASRTLGSNLSLAADRSKVLSGQVLLIRHTWCPYFAKVATCALPPLVVIASNGSSQPKRDIPAGRGANAAARGQAVSVGSGICSELNKRPLKDYGLIMCVDLSRVPF